MATPPVPLPQSLIDMHCHVFNGSDLPAINFIRRVITQAYSDDPDAISFGLGLFISLVAGRAPTAETELADIQAGRATPAATTPNFASTLTADSANLFKWVALFSKSRRELIAKLNGFYTATSNRCELITPALVDFSTWLSEPDIEGQRLSDQVAVMGAIGKLPGTPRVHGFVGFDPIRAILAKLGYNPGNHTSLPVIDPHKLVHDAVNKHGFLGVKLYPPMGFRAWNNAKGDIPFSSVVKKQITASPEGAISDKAVGKLIDAELAKLYRYCADNGVPILAHAYNSNQAEECTGWRASPQYWGEVIDKFSTPEKPLRLCLGHFGSFSAHERFKTCSSFENKAWEIIIGGILKKDAGKYVFADLSYLSEVLDTSPAGTTKLNKLATGFKSFIAANDTGVEHLCYGSDWNMLGRESGHEHYHVSMAKFLGGKVGLDAIRMNNVFFANAVRFLGLRPGDQARARLEKFYDDNNIGQYFPKIDPLTS